jgi:prolyl-tRNA synthetase
MPKTAISPTRDKDFPQWYQQVVRAADLAENSEVRGCMVIKPWGYGIWERIQQQLDCMFKATGHENAYFPLLIPLSYLEEEAKHAEGFATECAVVTHHRLQAEKDDVTGKTKLVPAGKLTEPLIVRPTSETIIGAAFARWIESYRDLPLLINQWANVMRWEMRPRLFLRTAEFLWQEGHTAHETKDQAIEETDRMLQVYKTFMQDHLAVPVIDGSKTENERFPGAEDTLCVEAMVQDRKAIQAGTSHFLGQNFAKASDITYQSREGTVDHVWTTSWGVSTRMIGMVIMAHGDDDGIILPPRIAPTHIVIQPIIPKEQHREAVLEAANTLATELRQQHFHHDALTVRVDDRDMQGGAKNWEWIKKGIPVRIEIGPRDLEKGTVAVARRDRGHKDKAFISNSELIATVTALLQEIQDGLFQRALDFQRQNTTEIDSKEAFYDHFKQQGKGNTNTSGWVSAHWAGSNEDEDEIKKDLQVTIRCIPFARDYQESGTCFFTGKPSNQRLIFAKSY